MPKITVTKAPTDDNAVLVSKNISPSLAKGAVGAQDFNKRTTATPPMRGRRALASPTRSLAKGGR